LIEAWITEMRSLLRTTVTDIDNNRNNSRKKDTRRVRLVQTGVQSARYEFAMSLITRRTLPPRVFPATPPLEYAILGSFADIFEQKFAWNSNFQENPAGGWTDFSL
jgi:hypothetical protein